MCGRYTIRRIDARRFGVNYPAGNDEEFVDHVNPGALFSARYNVAPSQVMPIIRVDRDGHRIVDHARWGLIPSWTKGKPKLAPINARCETAATSRMFRPALESRRCLIPADGFYEWKKLDEKNKQPFFIHMRDDEPFAFAGMYELWKPDEEAEPIVTYTILTTDPNPLMADIHNRMPAILAQKDYDRWLDRTKKASDVQDLLTPYDAAAMEAFPVSKRVNSPRNDAAELIERE